MSGIYNPNFVSEIKLRDPIFQNDIINGAIIKSNNYNDINNINILTGINNSINTIHNRLTNNETAINNNASSFITNTLNTNKLVVSNDITSKDLTTTGTINIHNNAININAPQTVFASGINYLSGNLVCSMPFTGSSFKLVLISFNNFKTTSNGSWTATYTFPKSFLSSAIQISGASSTIFAMNLYVFNQTSITFTVPPSSNLNIAFNLMGY